MARDPSESPSPIVPAQDRGNRARPHRFHPRFAILTELAEKLSAIVESESLPPGNEVLDYGCGNRPYEALFRRKFRSYIGADFPGNDLANVTIGPKGQLALPDESVDCVVSTQVLEHVEDPQFYLREAHRVLRADGALVLSTHGVWRYHPDPTDFWRWTIDGFQVELYRGGFDMWWLQSVFGLASCGLQLWQDATAERMPRGIRPLYFWAIQSLIRRIERRHVNEVSCDASVYIALAKKRPLTSVDNPFHF